MNQSNDDPLYMEKSFEDYNYNEAESASKYTIFSMSKRNVQILDHKTRSLWSTTLNNTMPIKQVELSNRAEETTCDSLG